MSNGSDLFSEQLSVVGTDNWPAIRVHGMQGFQREHVARPASIKASRSSARPTARAEKQIEQCGVPRLRDRKRSPIPPARSARINGPAQLSSATSSNDQHHKSLYTR